MVTLIEFCMMFIVNLTPSEQMMKWHCFKNDTEMVLFHPSFACFFPRKNATIFRKYLGPLKKLASQVRVNLRSQSLGPDE